MARATSVELLALGTPHTFRALLSWGIGRGGCVWEQQIQSSSGSQKRFFNSFDPYLWFHFLEYVAQGKTATCVL